MPTPTVGKIIQYLPSGAFTSQGVDFTQIQAGIIVQTNSSGQAILRIFGNDGSDYTINANEDDTQTIPNTWTYASQTS